MVCKVGFTSEVTGSVIKVIKISITVENRLRLFFLKPRNQRRDVLLALRMLVCVQQNVSEYGAREVVHESVMLVLIISTLGWFFTSFLTNRSRN